MEKSVHSESRYTLYEPVVNYRHPLEGDKMLAHIVVSEAAKAKGWDRIVVADSWVTTSLKSLPEVYQVAYHLKQLTNPDGSQRGNGGKFYTVVVEHNLGQVVHSRANTHKTTTHTHTHTHTSDGPSFPI